MMLLPAITFFIQTFATVATEDRTADVAIVGAGLSGLAAARDLTAAGKSVIVLEARDRVGGRVQNFNLTNGGVTELGAAFVGPTQDRVLALAADLGLQLFDEYNQGDNELLSDGNVSTYPASSPLPPLDDTSLLELANTVVQIDTLAATLDPHAPWQNPNSSIYDSLTFDSWLANLTTTPEAAAFVNTATVAIFSATPAELSLLYVLAYVAAAGNETTRGTFERLFTVQDGAQQSRIRGGTGLLAAGLVAQVGADQILLGAPVRSIAATAAGYLVTADHGITATAKAVVVAMSPPLAARIAYDPPLPAARDQLTQRMFMGSLGKAVAVYDTPFWREANQTGQAVSDGGTTRATFDDSPEDGSFGAMLGFLEADQMRALDGATDEEIQRLVSRDFVEYFGPRAADVKQWVVKRWDNEVYSRGGPVALAGPGTLTRYGHALTEAAGGIHFAGTESSPYWTGYMDGAIRSGERVAAEIVAACDVE